MPIRKRADRFQVRVSLRGGRRVERTLPAGARRADAVALEATLRRAVIDQVVGRPRRFTIADALVDDVVAGAVRVDSRSKSGRPRLVPLAPEAAKIAGKRHPFDLTAPQIVRLWIEARKAARMPGVRLDDLRHTFGSLLVQQGADAATVRDLMGHSSLGVTSRYVHGVPEAAARAARGLSVGRQPRVRRGQEHREEGRFLT
jgi:integrase